MVAEDVQQGLKALKSFDADMTHGAMRVNGNATPDRDESRSAWGKSVAPGLNHLWITGNT